MEYNIWNGRNVGGFPANLHHASHQPDRSADDGPRRLQFDSGNTFSGNEQAFTGFVLDTTGDEAYMQRFCSSSDDSKVGPGCDVTRRSGIMASALKEKLSREAAQMKAMQHQVVSGSIIQEFGTSTNVDRLGIPININHDGGSWNRAIGQSTPTSLAETGTPGSICSPWGRGKCCFNCGESHMIADCPWPIDRQQVATRKRAFLEQSEANALKRLRYHDEAYIKRSFTPTPTPGVLSSALRSALGLSPGQLPKHIYKMRRIGYPPGYKEQLVELHKSRIVSTRGQGGDIFLLNSAKLSIESIHSYPGFNTHPSCDYYVQDPRERMKHSPNETYDYGKNSREVFYKELQHELNLSTNLSEEFSTSSTELSSPFDAASNSQRSSPCGTSSAILAEHSVRGTPQALPPPQPEIRHMGWSPAEENRYAEWEGRQDQAGRVSSEPMLGHVFEYPARYDQIGNQSNQRSHSVNPRERWLLANDQVVHQVDKHPPAPLKSENINSMEKADWDDEEASPDAMQEELNLKALEALKEKNRGEEPGAPGEEIMANYWTTTEVERHRMRKIFLSDLVQSRTRRSKEVPCMETFCREREAREELATENALHTIDLEKRCNHILNVGEVMQGKSINTCHLPGSSSTKIGSEVISDKAPSTSRDSGFRKRTPSPSLLTDYYPSSPQFREIVLNPFGGDRISLNASTSIQKVSLGHQDIQTLSVSAKSPQSGDDDEIEEIPVVKVPPLIVTIEDLPKISEASADCSDEDRGVCAYLAEDPETEITAGENVADVAKTDLSSEVVGGPVTTSLRTQDFPGGVYAQALASGRGVFRNVYSNSHLSLPNLDNFATGVEHPLLLVPEVESPGTYNRVNDILSRRRRTRKSALSTNTSPSQNQD